MTTSTAAVGQDRQDERKRKRAAIVKFSLAGAALVGIAAAATSAAWTDDAWFSATASAVDNDGVELQGSLTDVDASYVDADSSVASIVIPATELENLVPDETRTFTVYIRNDGDVDLNVDAAVVATGLLADATVSTDFTDGTTIVPSSVGTPVEVTVTADGWDETFQGETGALTLQFSGSTVD
ncbi:hypothetical protein KIN34_02415 [Cellulomonas sp. DKR-3]|uniref:Ribosomally synthesized peptide with SipW-like signal peptide n=1 Tax=Cellulomonas fulva TaxID=2835530 RepID=A0ABS5TVI0_9CELL|nr:hypothetical protein [Cellulomonas fulva]MBT0993145.1 hypothetical protein [Cellulomonas fulva]